MKKPFAVAGVILAGGGWLLWSCTRSEPTVAAPATPIVTDLKGYRPFPADNPWNTPIDKLPVHANSSAYVASIGPDRGLHPDFGANWNGGPFGIPYIVSDGTAPGVPVSFEYADESDPGPYPIPDNTPIEGGEHATGDRHMLVINPKAHRLYELYAVQPKREGTKIKSIAAGSGAIFDLTSNKLRPAGWTSADAAGLPIFPGLVRFDEVSRGEIKHALRFTVRRSQRAYIAPATHFASPDRSPNLPPMGLRFRLKASFDESGFPPEAQVVLRALKKYGMFLADNGSDWFISGAPDSRWNDAAINTLKRVKGREFEAVQTGPIVKG